MRMSHRTAGGNCAEFGRAARFAIGSVAALLTITMTTAPLAAGPNLLLNAGFEEGPRVDCSGIGKHWESPRDGCVGFIQSLSTTRHSGNWAQRLGGSTAWDLGWVQQVTDYNSVQPGKTYEAIAWIKTQNIDNPAGWNVFRCDPFINESTPQHNNMPQQETHNYDWREIRWQFTIPLGSGINRLGAILSRHWGNGTVWYDDIVIREVDTGPPEISIAPASFTREVIAGQGLASDSFTVQNAGGGLLSYTVSEDATWLSVNPTTGASNGQADTITITYATGALPLGNHAADITISAGDATNSPRTVTVSLTVIPPPIPGDMDGDRDVDQADYGRFQRCLNVPGQIQSDPACDLAKLDGDVDVDQDDFGLFQACMTGPNITGDPNCAD